MKPKKVVIEAKLDTGGVVRELRSASELGRSNHRGPFNRNYNAKNSGRSDKKPIENR